MIEALRFAYMCYRMILRSHQRSADHSGFATYTQNKLGVAEVSMILGTGRHAWRVSDMATNYFANRGVTLE